MGHPAEIIATAYKHFESLNYKSLKSFPLLTNDPTLLFTNSSIAPFKSLMIKGDDMEKTFLVQKCFRNRYHGQGLFGFQMLGLLSNIERSDEVQNELLGFVINILGIKKSRLHVVLDPRNHVLLGYCERQFQKERLHFCQNHPKYSTSWQFGAGDLLRGKGLTLVVESIDLQKCGSECDVFCSCQYYFPIGNVIEIESSGSNRRYIEIGVGIEAILASLTNCDYYSVHPYSLIVPDFIKRGFSLTDARQLARCYVGGSILAEEGIKPANKGAGYILKRMIRKIYEIVLANRKSFSQAQEVIHEFVVPTHIVWGDYVGFKQMMDLTFPPYVKTIKYGLAQLNKITEVKTEEPEASILDYYHETYGIPRFLIEQHLKNADSQD